MKTATLHTGQILNFPDATSDEDIDAHVQQHMDAHQQAERQRVEAEQKEKMARAGDLHYQAVTQEHAADRKQRDTHHDHHMMVAVAGHQQQAVSDHTRNAHLEGMHGQLAQLNQQLSSVQHIAPILMQLTQSVAALTTEIRSAVDKIVKTLGAEKSLKFDPRGRPIGIKPKMIEQEDAAEPKDTVMPPAGNA